MWVSDLGWGGGGEFVKQVAVRVRSLSLGFIFVILYLSDKHYVVTLHRIEVRSQEELRTLYSEELQCL